MRPFHAAMTPNEARSISAVPPPCTHSRMKVRFGPTGDVDFSVAPRSSSEGRTIDQGLAGYEFDRISLRDHVEARQTTRDGT